MAESVVKELCHCNVICLLRLQEFSHRDVIITASWLISKEFGNRDIVVFQEFRDRNVILFEQLLHSGVVEEEVGKCRLHELCDGDVVGFEEFGRGGAEELADGAVIVEELGNSDVIRCQILGDSNVIWCCKEFGH